MAPVGATETKRAPPPQAGQLVRVSLLAAAAVYAPLAFATGLPHWLAAGAAVATVAVLFLLSAPSRAVGAGYYSRAHPRRFLVTGAASGIGFDVARALLARGDIVVATDINIDGLAAKLKRAAAVEPDPVPEKAAVVDATPQPLGLASEARLRVLQLDVRCPNAWEAAVHHCEEALGGVDVCMNIAGYLAPCRYSTFAFRRRWPHKQHPCP